MAEQKYENIYVVEDDPLGRRYLVEYLQLAGYDNIIAFPTVDAALEHMGWSKEKPELTQNLPDAIITDYDTKSGYTGFDLLAAVKNTNIARIMTTGSEITLANVIAAGGSQAKLISKPIDQAKLVDALEVALREKDAPGRRPGE